MTGRWFYRKVVAGPTALFITLRGLQCVRENRRQNESRRGRLNFRPVQISETTSFLTM
jgi:hypothetical protein